MWRPVSSLMHVQLLSGMRGREGSGRVQCMGAKGFHAAPDQAHPDVPVVERMEDLWRVSKLQRERKARAEANTARKPDGATPCLSEAQPNGGRTAPEDPAADAANSGSSSAQQHAESTQEPGAACTGEDAVPCSENMPAIGGAKEGGAVESQPQPQGCGKAVPAYDDLD